MTISKLVLNSAVAVGLAAAACGSPAGPGTESDTGPAVTEPLVIRVQNLTDSVQYVFDPGYWMTGGPESVHLVNHGNPDVPLALYSNQPTCEAILDGRGSCSSHGDRAPGLVAIAPGAVYVDQWDGMVWEATSVDTDGRSCLCVRRVPAPEGVYGVACETDDEADCGDSGTDCMCDPGNDTCTTYFAYVRAGAPLEANVNWPSDHEVVLRLE